MSPIIPDNSKAGFGNYLCSADSFGSKNKSIASMLILLTWLVVVIVVSAKHELWRDEVRALSIALEPASIWHLPSAIKGDGHPILWFLILRVAFGVTQTPVILKVVSICVAFGGVAIFYRYAPFPVWQKILFIFGILPFYEYSVMARNYGISMLLFFLFAALYTQREKRTLLFACVLAALSNTNAHSCILAAVLAAFWFIDDVVIGYKSLNFRRTTALTGAFILIGTGVFCSIATILPPHDTILTQALSLNFSQVMNALWMNIKHPGLQFGSVLFGEPVVIRDLLLWLLVAGLLIRPHAAAALFVGLILLGTFFTTVYPGGLRHQGIFIIFVISLYWIVYQEVAIFKKDKPRHYLYFIFKVSVYVVLPAILINHMQLSPKKIYRDVHKEMSSSSAFGRFVKTHSEYHDAIIMGDPDCFLESFPYYIPNRIYIPREKRFGNRVMWTTASQARMSLGELLTIAQQIRNSEKKPVLIVIGHFELTNQQRFEKRFSYNKVLTWSLEELAAFKSKTIKVAEFKTAVRDENYAVYRLL